MLEGVAGICLIHSGVTLAASLEDGERMLYEMLAALWFKPTTVEFSAMEQVVSDTTDQQQDQFRPTLMVW
ncbi:hypothetical protein BKX93_03520 [Chromobacterium vaccinii]|uniref:Uncharacterized protein n=1 Tax=Chromobacterium vaccinii TaxID=1108595 RepID=A0A1D9LD23_9NEIS|nr:hypothetical protein BKX93_03520 [Chromobacterium vaccinii]